MIDLPVGLYFRKFLNEVTEGALADEGADIDAKFISDAMKDYSINQIQLRVRKIWINEFFDFCETALEETSCEVMSDLLKFEADC